MKKVFLSFLVFFSFIFVDRVYAESYWSTVDAKENIAEGEKVPVDFVFDFEDAKSYDSKYGIYMIAFEIKFDDTVFDIVDIEYNSNWNQEVDKADGKYIAVAVPKSSNNNIRLNIGKFIMRLYFKAKTTNKTSTTIKIGEYGGILLDKSAIYNDEINDSDFKTIKAEGDYTHTFKISKSQIPVDNKPSSIVQNKNSVDINSSIKKETSTIKKKETNTNTDNTNSSYNNYLKSLEIEGYKISFNKHQSIYSVEVEENVEKLKVKAVAESSKSKVEVIGADNIKESNNIIIKVTSQNKEEKKYIINIKKVKEKKEEKIFNFSITDEQKNMIIIFAGSVLFIGLIIYIIIRIRDRKIEKNIDKW